jgi:hypothetical protein
VTDIEKNEQSTAPRGANCIDSARFTNGDKTFGRTTNVAGSPGLSAQNPAVTLDLDRTHRDQSAP